MEETARAELEHQRRELDLVSVMAGGLAQEFFTEHRHALEERFQEPGYRTDGELMREVTSLTERLAGPYLGNRRQAAEDRLAALQAEQEARRHARSPRRGETTMSELPEGSKHHEGDGCEPYPGTEDRDEDENA